MTVKDLQEAGFLEVVWEGEEPEREIEDVFCCDLLSIAMSRGIENAAWITVMGNINTLAVMSLTDMSCVVLAEGANLDETALAKAKQEGFPVFRTEEAIFPTAKRIYEMIGK